MKKFFAIFWVLFSFRLEAHETCENQLDFEAKPFQSSIGMYPNFAVENAVSTDTLKDIIHSFGDTLWTMKVVCVNDEILRFDMYLAESKVKEMAGFFTLRAGKYFSGPHSSLDPNVVIIITDSGTLRKTIK
jgi:hypothetical protein